jgi:hypothetical protein
MRTGPYRYINVIVIVGDQRYRTDTFALVQIYRWVGKTDWRKRNRLWTTDGRCPTSYIQQHTLASNVLGYNMMRDGVGN